MQSTFYGKEIECLKTGKGLPKGSFLSKLNPILENGLLRVGGRLKTANISFAQKHPIILPSNHVIAQKILINIHETNGHCGREHVLSILRETLWITKANSATRKVLLNCVTCRKIRAKPSFQQMADLPEDRLTLNKPPFTNVGVDCFGPFIVRKGRTDHKRYGVVFTCLAVRAIHIEVVQSLDTSSFIMALRRFCARRGQVQEIRSDNGSNFVSSNKELKLAIKAWNKNQIHEFLLQRNIKWLFNPPYASHFGGVWERQIRSIRKILLSVCKEQLLTDESLHTLLCEVEYIVNSRPLTKSSDDPNDLEALTPNHLLLLKTEVSAPWCL